MDEFVIMGLVLQEIEYGEADRILKILTAEKGLITAFAKNSMRLTSHLFAACGQLCYSEFVLRPGRGTEDRMYTVVEAGYETDFRGIGYSFEAQGVAMYMVEFTLGLSLADQPAEAELKLLMNCLYKICQQTTDPKLVKAVFELRMMCLCGFQPQLLCCQGCGAYDGSRFYLDAFIWIGKTGGCSARAAPPRRTWPAISTRAPSLRCGTSALQRTGNCSVSASRPQAPGCSLPRRSSMPWPIWISSSTL